MARPRGDSPSARLVSRAWMPYKTDIFAAPMGEHLFEVVCVGDCNYNVIRIVLRAPQPLDLKIGSHVLIYNDLGDCRPYSPLRFDEHTLEFAIKVYPGGKLSPYLASRKAGDEVRVGMLPARLNYRLNEHRNVLMLCGGTGITPAFQLLNHALNAEENRTKFTLIFFNSTRQDVFLRDELEDLQKPDGSSRLRVRHVYTREMVDRSMQNDRSVANKVLEDIVIEAVSSNDFDFVYTCGPPGFMDVMSGNKTPDRKQGELSGVLKKLGFTSDTVYKF